MACHERSSVRAGRAPSAPQPCRCLLLCNTPGCIVLPAPSSPAPHRCSAETCQGAAGHGTCVSAGGDAAMELGRPRELPLAAAAWRCQLAHPRARPEGSGHDFFTRGEQRQRGTACSRRRLIGLPNVPPTRAWTPPLVQGTTPRGSAGASSSRGGVAAPTWRQQT